jgi:hypothetical protein
LVVLWSDFHSPFILALLANMIQLHQTDPIRHGDLLPNTYVFNTVINCWAKSRDHDAASKAEEMLVAMSRLHASGMPSLKPDAFTYTAVIDAWAKSGYRGAATRADQLLDKMEVRLFSATKWWQTLACLIEPRTMDCTHTFSLHTLDKVSGR